MSSAGQLTGPLADQLAADFGDWSPVLQAWATSDAGRATVAAVDARVAAGATVYPAQVFRALSITPRVTTKVVILGQDPYHGPGQAEGLAFSVPIGRTLPPSLRNIVKELQRDLGVTAPTSGSLLPWAVQGVLMLNTSLTVEDGRPASHDKLGWHVLTDQICKTLLEDPEPKVFMLWGAHAQARVPGPARASPHRVLESSHPSPLSAHRRPLPFMGCGHFGKANRQLSAWGRGVVEWQLP